MLARVLNVINFRIVEKKLNLAVHIDPRIPYSVICDEQRLAQVVANLFSNAVKFTPENGEIQLLATMTEQRGNEVTLLVTVRDSGIGIPKEHQGKLFNSFEQADGGISRKFGGTGLGLAISKRIVEMMGGEIWVESEAGQGARFSFTFKAEIGRDGRLSALDGVASWRDVRVLAVDADEDARAFFENLAATLGFTCVTAETAAAGESILNIRGRDAFHAVFIARDGPDCPNTGLARNLIASGNGDAVVMVLPASEWSNIDKNAGYGEMRRFLVKPLLSFAVVENIAASVTGPRTELPGLARKGNGDLTGHRILLAEDIAINREVVLTLLEDTGAVIDCAENGAVACDMFAAAPGAYSLILMDIHMPEVDGYQATRRIRAMNAIPEAGNIPIIAMTANVFKEDRDQCLAAGMDGHISKPIDLDEMLATLQKYCLPDRRQS